MENEKDIDSALALWYEFVLSTLNKHAPLKTKRVRNCKNPEWLTPEIRHARQKRDYFHKKKDFTNYKIWRNKCTSLINMTKQSFYKTSIEQAKSPNDMWKLVKDIANSNKQDHFPTQIIVNDQILTQDKKITNALNEHFVNVATNLNINQNSLFDSNKIYREVNSKVPQDIWFNIPLITNSEVSDYLLNLDVTKSTGLDQISPYILKLSTQIITPSITYLINQSILTGVFPSDLKIARVMPTFKNGSKDIADNYRPISILPTLSKIIEKHVCKHLYRYLVKYKLLHLSQSGFRSSHSCHTALIKLIDQWLKAIDDGDFTGVIYLDFKKAFDLVDHLILLQKLQIYKVSHSSCIWFKSYLSDRLQQVVKGSIKSNLLEIKQGVPQGSILGPLLFLVFINDLPLHVEHSNTDLYADDTTLHFTYSNIDTIHKKLQDDLDIIQLWCSNNKMKINPTKTTSMLIGSHQKLSKIIYAPQFKICNSSIKNVESEKLLGIKIDKSLDWNIQVDFVCTKVSNRLNLLSKIKLSLPLESRKLFYNAYILPLLDYCCTIWGNTTMQSIERIDKLQKRAARLILDLPYETPSKTLFEKLSWLKFADRIDYHKLVTVHKCLYGNAPEYLAEKVIYNTYDSTKQLRSNTNKLLKVPKSRTNIFQKSFAYSGPSIWNKLPGTLRFTKSICTFKSKCFELLLKNPGILH